MNYVIEDGTAETGIGLTDPAGGFSDIIWLNQFNSAAGGEIIKTLQIAYGGSTDTRIYSGTPLHIVLYTDPDGGSTTNAIYNAASSFNTTIPAVYTNGTFVTYNLATPMTVPTGTSFLVGVVAHGVVNGTSNSDPAARFLSAQDTTDPDLANRSFIGFTDGANSMNETNLASIPAGQYAAIDTFGLPGNWLIRAVGDPIPEPASLGLLAIGGLLLARRRAA